MAARNVAAGDERQDDLHMPETVDPTSPPIWRLRVRRSLRPAALWVLCSAGAVAFFIGIESCANRLVVAAKLEEIGVWGFYVGIVLRGFANFMLTPVTASGIVGLPDWLDFALSVTIMAGWGAATFAVVRRLRMAHGR